MCLTAVKMVALAPKRGFSVFVTKPQAKQQLHIDFPLHQPLPCQKICKVKKYTKPQWASTTQQPERLSHRIVNRDYKEEATSITVEQEAGVGVYLISS